MKKFIKNMKFSQKITSFFALIISVICVITSIQFEKSTENIKEARVRNLETYVLQLNKAISAQFFERYGDVQAFTRNEVFLSKNKNHMTQTLNDYSNLYGIYNLIMYVDTDGHLISVNNQGPDKAKINISKLYEMNFKDEQWFTDSMKENYTKDTQKGFNGTVFIPFINDSLVSDVYGIPTQTSLFAAPVKDRDGKIIGVICNRAHSKWFIDELNNLKQELGKENWANATLNILDGNKKTVASVQIGETKTNEDLPTDVITQTLPIEENKFLSEVQWSGSLSVPKNILLQDVLESEKQFFSVLAIIFILALTASYFVAYRISLELEKISNTIAEMSDFTAHMTQEFSKSSEGLSKNSVEQAASIQQSVAALSQMTSMISNTSDKIRNSSDISKSVQGKASAGKQIMEKVIHSMDDIRDTNLELQEINRTMAKISQKTELINDIVFKTQLLSFNASIEAARAGQNGRGFSVVAEEVSHLAELSGKASKEIETLLNESKRKVEDSLVSIQAKITDGSQITLEANQTFNEITESIESISKQLSSVSESTEQQSLGVNQANTAMKQLEVSADSNSSTANEFTRRFNELKNKTQDLSSATSNLKKIVNG